MLFSLKRAIAGVALASLCGLTLWGQAGTPQWKDRAEYDLVESIKKEQNAATKLGLLQQWEEKYPTSDFKDGRFELIVSTYQALGKAKEMMDSAKKWAEFNPKALQAHTFICNLTPFLNDTSGPALDAGEKAANAILGLVEDALSPARKPQQVTDEQWKQHRQTTESAAYRTLGWVDLQRAATTPEAEKDKKIALNEEADKHFLEALKRNPADTQASTWAGSANIRTRKLERQGIALFHFARAGYYDGPGAMDAKTRATLTANFEKNYVNFHGSKDGIEAVIAAAKASPIPEGIKIESQDEILQKQEEELKKTNPQLALWLTIKRELTKAEGAAYFQGSLKDSQIPGGAEVGGTKVEKLKGKLVSCDKPKLAKKLVVGVSSAEMSEITLALPAAIAACPEKGTELEFSGQVIEFTAEPFNVTFDVETKDVTGLPVAAPAKKAAAPAKKAAAPAKK